MAVKKETVERALYRRQIYESYKIKLIEAMLEMGATEKDILLIKDATIYNAIQKNRKPEDVAWAILQ